MTKDEIKALVASKIAGQGTNVDGGGALSDVLNAILDAIPEGGSTSAKVYEKITIDVSGETIEYSLENVTEEEAASALNTTIQSVQRILNGEVAFMDIIYDTNARAFLTFTKRESYEDDVTVDYEDSYGAQFSIQRGGSGVSVYFNN